VLVGFIALLTAASFRFPPGRNTPAFAASIIGLSVLVIAICWWKGEPPEVALGPVRFMPEPEGARLARGTCRLASGRTGSQGLAARHVRAVQVRKPGPDNSPKYCPYTTAG